MDEKTMLRLLQEQVGAENVFSNEPLSRHTTFRIGGPAQWLVTPTSEKALTVVASLCRKMGIPVRILGAGSNVLAPDDGLDGVTIKLADKFSNVEVLPGGLVRAQAGATNEAVAAVALASGLSGYEFACGIPGTVGGAAIMNAGAYEGQFSDVAVEIRCLTAAGELVTLSAVQADWGYRTSRMMHEGMVVVEAMLQLRPDAPEAIEARMTDLTARREEKQPLEMPSAGSTFKRPEGHFAGKLIQDAGLQGTSVGGAQVSTKHAGFVVNVGDATAADVLDLIQLVQKRVFEDTGVLLEPEVRLWS